MIELMNSVWSELYVYKCICVRYIWSDDNNAMSNKHTKNELYVFIVTNVTFNLLFSDKHHATVLSVFYPLFPFKYEEKKLLTINVSVVFHTVIKFTKFLKFDARSPTTKCISRESDTSVYSMESIEWRWNGLATICLFEIVWNIFDFIYAIYDCCRHGI